MALGNFLIHLCQKVKTLLLLSLNFSDILILSQPKLSSQHAKWVILHYF